MARMSGQDTDNNNIVEDKDSGNYDGGLATDKVTMARTMLVKVKCKTLIMLTMIMARTTVYQRLR